MQTTDMRYNVSIFLNMFSEHAQLYVRNKTSLFSLYMFMYPFIFPCAQCDTMFRDKTIPTIFIG